MASKKNKARLSPVMALASSGKGRIMIFVFLIGKQNHLNR